MEMAKIYAPNKEYNGVSASVAFENGVGECNNPASLAWFREHGYEVEAAKPRAKPPAKPGMIEGHICPTGHPGEMGPPGEPNKSKE